MSSAENPQGAIIKPFQNPFFEEGIRVILSSGTEPVMAFPEWRELKMGPHHVYAYTMTLVSDFVPIVSHFDFFSSAMRSTCV